MTKKEVITICEYKVEDLDTLRNLFLRSRMATFHWIDPSTFHLSDFDEETKGESILVAFTNDISVGFISVWEADQFIHHLYVDDRFQHQGVGTRLIDAVAEKFGLPLRLKCETNNTKAITFYKQKGFVEKERGASEAGTYILFELCKK